MVQQASMLQQTPFLEPRINVAEESRRDQRAPFASPSQASRLGEDRSGATASQRKTFLTRDTISGGEAFSLSATDVGNLLKKSSSGLSAGIQSKTPVVSDPRVRGSRIGSLAASGSHWVPARADLDTILSKFDSQQMILALGRDWKESSLEFSVLRLDQTDVIFPGYVFDLDYLVTDGYDITHTQRDLGGMDAVVTDAWYNRTRFQGSALNPQKQIFFPVLDLINYVGTTDVDSMSTGYRQSLLVGDLSSEGFQFTAGHVLRWVKQELNEISSGTTLGLPFLFNNRNSPIPRSFMANPGLFVDYKEEVGERLGVNLGARVDYASSQITDDADKLSGIGIGFFPASYANIVGTSEYDRQFSLASAFMSLRHDSSDEIASTLSAGYAERAPTLTELYAAQPFMLLLQNGLNNVTVDPTLAKERLFQIDFGSEYSCDDLRTGFRCFHAWGLDYITFENTRVNIVPPAGEVGQVSLRYVNTELATILGGEWFGELFPTSPLTPFANVRVVDGRDRTRNGRFATSNGNALVASQKVNGQARGAFSGVVGG